MIKLEVHDTFKVYCVICSKDRNTLFKNICFFRKITKLIKESCLNIFFSLGILYSIAVFLGDNGILT
jgi:hypothetical protein